MAVLGVATYDIFSLSVPAESGLPPCFVTWFACFGRSAQRDHAGQGTLLPVTVEPL
jgi:hypothetical protein